MSKAMERERGLQSERTTLAWSRSALLFVTSVVMVLRFGLPSVLNLVALTFGLCVLLTGVHNRQNELLKSGKPLVNMQVMIRHAFLSSFVSLAALWVFLI